MLDRIWNSVFRSFADVFIVIVWVIFAGVFFAVVLANDETLTFQKLILITFTLPLSVAVVVVCNAILMALGKTFDCKIITKIRSARVHGKHAPAEVRS